MDAKGREELCVSQHLQTDTKDYFKKMVDIKSPHNIDDSGAQHNGAETDNQQNLNPQKKSLSKHMFGIPIGPNSVII